MKKINHRKVFKQMFYFILSLIILFSLITFAILQMNTFGAEATGERLERMKQSKHYKNGQFQNLNHTPAFAEGYDAKKVMWDFIFGKKDSNISPKDSIPHIQTDILSIDPSENIFIWLGHSSYYIQLDGVNFLIDPVFSEHGSPLPIFNKAFKGANTYHTKDFPKIDYLVISHDHYDHLDYETVKELQHKVDKVILPLGVGAHFEKWNYLPEQLIEEEWYTTIKLKNNLEITFTPARHFSGRKFKRNVTLWTSYVLKTPTQKLFLGGDSGYDTHFKEIGEKYGQFDFAILENGQYNDAWKYIHALPTDIPAIVTDLKAKHIIPVHAAKFALAKHAWDEPLEKVVEYGKQNKVDILTPMIGETVNLNDSVFYFKEWWKG
ncbi:MBL fold metallo-hydrolase [uncultured Empedobacter sp.]|uniref:MBL fold metallo-hydrolase n=1 Tax=uncultured Empedobacter sp. TaxID=410844 RepID=UPI00261D4009|nr:MBL fold metallo-hydrolase [uncultured Empedobacter sp.]